MCFGFRQMRIETAFGNPSPVAMSDIQTDPSYWMVLLLARHPADLNAVEHLRKIIGEACVNQSPFHALGENSRRRLMPEQIHTCEKKIEDIEMIAQVGRVNKIEPHRRHVKQGEIESISRVQLPFGLSLIQTIRQHPFFQLLFTILKQWM